MWIYCRYITKNGVRIYPKNKRYFRFWVDDEKAVKKGNTDLLARVNRGLRTIKRNGEFAVIYKKWFGKEPPKALFE